MTDTATVDFENYTNKIKIDTKIAIPYAHFVFKRVILELDKLEKT